MEGGMPLITTGGIPDVMTFLQCNGLFYIYWRWMNVVLGIDDLFFMMCRLTVIYITLSCRHLIPCC